MSNPLPSDPVVEADLIAELREAADQERHASTYLADLMFRAAEVLSSQSVRVKELEGELAQARQDLLDQRAM